MLGNLAQTRITGGLVTDYQYDALNRLDLMRHYTDDGDNLWEQGIDTLLSEFDYTVRADGKRTAVDEQVFDGTTTKATRVDWLYDNIGRLAQEDYNADGAALDFTADYLFDLVGNRLEKSVDQGRDSTVDETIDYVYDANDRLLSATKDAAVDSHTVYTYDDTQQIAKDVYTDDTLATPLAKTDYA